MIILNNDNIETLGNQLWNPVWMKVKYQVKNKISGEVANKVDTHIWLLLMENLNIHFLSVIMDHIYKN